MLYIIESQSLDCTNNKSCKRLCLISVVNILPTVSVQTYSITRTPLTVQGDQI